MPSILGLLPELATTMSRPWLSFAALALASQYDYAPPTTKPKSPTPTTTKPVLHALALDFTSPPSSSSSAFSTPLPATTTPSSPIEIPLELILDIIEIAAAPSDPINAPLNTSVLRTCTLVCKAWSLPVQRLLFRSVSLRSRPQYTSFVRSVSRKTPKGRVLREAVRDLKVTVDYAHPSPISQHAFAHAVSVCPRLRHLDVAVYGTCEAEMKRHAPSFSEHTLNTLRDGPAIESLSLRNWTENTELPFQLLDVYASISSLSLSGSTPSAPPNDALWWPGRLSSLHLNLQTAPSPDFVSWLLSSTSASSSLRHLAFDREPSSELFEGLMSTCGRDLRSLSVPSLPTPSIHPTTASHHHSTSNAPSGSVSASSAVVAVAASTTSATTLPPPSMGSSGSVSGTNVAGSSSGTILEGGLGGACGIEICERLETLRMDRPHLSVAALKSVPRTVKHLVLGLDKDTSMPPVVDLVKGRGGREGGLEVVTVKMWNGGAGHRALPMLKMACAMRGVELECV